MRRLEFYGNGGATLVKVLELRDYQKIDNVPVAHTLEMRNLQNRSETFVQVSDVRYNLNLPDSLFVQRSLEKGPAAVSVSAP
jgi:hypothetical protein